MNERERKNALAQRVAQARKTLPRGNDCQIARDVLKELNVRDMVCRDYFGKKAKGDLLEIDRQRRRDERMRNWDRKIPSVWFGADGLRALGEQFNTFVREKMPGCEEEGLIRAQCASTVRYMVLETAKLSAAYAALASMPETENEQQDFQRILTHIGYRNTSALAAQYRYISTRPHWFSPDPNSMKQMVPSAFRGAEWKTAARQAEEVERAYRAAVENNEKLRGEMEAAIAAWLLQPPPPYEPQNMRLFEAMRRVLDKQRYESLLAPDRELGRIKRDFAAFADEMERELLAPFAPPQNTGEKG